MTVIDLIAAIVCLYENHYPERLKKAIIINSEYSLFTNSQTISRDIFGKKEHARKGKRACRYGRRIFVFDAVPYKYLFNILVQTPKAKVERQRENIFSNINVNV